MALSGSSSGLLVALVAVLLLPVQYYVPDLYHSGGLSKQTAGTSPPAPQAWLDLATANISLLDLGFTISLIVAAFFTYLCEWIQRKLMERRIVKMNEFLSSSLQRLRSWDDQQEKLEATLRTVRSATGEYELLLWLLLRSNKLQTAPESLKTVNHEIKTATDWDMGMEPDLDPYMTPKSSRSSTNMEYTRS